MQTYFKFILVPFFIVMLSGCVLDNRGDKNYSENVKHLEIDIFDNEASISKQESVVVPVSSVKSEIMTKLMMESEHENVVPKVVLAPKPKPMPKIEYVVMTEAIIKPVLVVIEEPEAPTPIIEQIAEPEVDCSVGNAKQQGIIRDVYNGRGVRDVRITINGCSTKTDISGFYSLNNILEDESANLTIEDKERYLHSTTVAIKEYAGDDTIATNYMEYQINRYSTISSYYAYKGMNNSIGVVSSDTVYTDMDGIEYNGLIYVGWTFRDTMEEKGRDAFPGAYEGRNLNGEIVPFVSYGFFSLELKNVKNELLNTSGNIRIKLDNITGTKEDRISLWYYNYTEGLWVEEGNATREVDGSYSVQITHAGTWSLNKALKEEQGIYRGSVVDINGYPLTEVRLSAVGENWISKDLSTDEDGNFEIKVIPNSNFRLKAYNYKEKYTAVYSQEIVGISPGVVYED